MKTTVLLLWMAILSIPCIQLPAQRPVPVAAPAEMAEPVELFPDVPDYVAAFFSRYLTTAVRVSWDYHVPAAIMLAAAALESGYGLAENPVVQDCHNLFNIKTWVNADPTCCMAVDEIDYIDSAACFRKYFTPEESFLDYARMLAGAEHFRHLVRLPRWDYRAWAEGLYEAGYALDPEYAGKLIRIIERYELWRFDPVPCPHPYSEIEAGCGP